MRTYPGRKALFENIRHVALVHTTYRDDLHANGTWKDIVHGDVKCENVLIFEERAESTHADSESE